MDRAPVTFEDVAVYFSRREWESLSEGQKSLYKEVMNDNYQMILSLNCPDIIQNIELGCEPYVQSHHEAAHTGSTKEETMEDGSAFQNSCGDVKSGRFEVQVKRSRRYPRVNPIRWMKKEKKRKSRHSRSSQHTSRRSEDIKTIGVDHAVKSSPDPSHFSQDSVSKTRNEPLPGDPLLDVQGCRSLGSGGQIDHVTVAESSHCPGEAMGPCEKQEDVSEGSSLTRGSRFTADLILGEKHKDGFPEDDVDSEVYGDSTALSNTPDLLMEANSDSLSMQGTPKAENGEERRKSLTGKKKAPHHKKDRHVKFNEIVTMFLIEEHSVAHTSEIRLPISNNINDTDMNKKVEKSTVGLDVKDDSPSQGEVALPKNVEGTENPKKKMTVSTCEAKEVENSGIGPVKCSTKRIVDGVETSQGAPELESPSATKQTVKLRHELHDIETVKDRNCHTEMKSEDQTVDTSSASPTPNTYLISHEQRFIKSYTCINCGKVTHWSRLSVQQKKNVEKSIAHMCRMCIRRTSNTAATTPAQTVGPLSLATSIGSGEISQPGNQKILLYSPAQPDTPKILSDKKKQIKHKDERNEKTSVKQGSHITTGHQRLAAKNEKSPDGKNSNVYRNCGNPGVALIPKLKTFIGSLSNNSSPAGGSPLGLDSRKSKMGTKDKKETSKEQPINPGESEKGGGSIKSENCYSPEQRKGHLSPDQQKKAGKSPIVLLRDHLYAAPKMHSPDVNKIKNTSHIVEPEDLKSDTDCAKCSKSLAEHVHSESPGEGGEMNCVLRVKKKRKEPLDGVHPYECEQCGKTFTRHFTLMQHRTVHTGERPYSCKVCGKTFRDGGYLKVHMRLHTKEKPYTCSECGKRFGQNSALVTHLRIHTDERPFQCNDCGKRFTDRSTFRHHHMIHTGEKPFTCSFCGKKFTQQAHVKRHEKMHTGERPFGCTMCEKRFVDRTKLRKHELTHNRVKV